MKKLIQSLPNLKLLHFLHIGKTGGSAINFAIKQRDKATSLNFDICMHPHNFLLRDVPVGEKVFFILRDPLSRFVSGFNSRYRQGRPKYYYPWGEAETIAFSIFSTPNELALALSSVDPNEKAQARLAMQQIWHVNSSFWWWFETEEYFKSRFSDILFIGFQERLTEDFEVLKLLVGLPESVQLPDDDFVAHRSPLHQDRNLDIQAKANLKVWYKKDFEFIEICQQCIKKYRSYGLCEG